MASGSFPIYFDYEKIEGRTFWDGGLLSNTPLRELLQAHRDYYYQPPERIDIPELEVYVINVWPYHEKQAPSDYDGIKDRRNDITYADKTEHDQRVTVSITDYIDLFEQTKAIADEAINAIPDTAKKRQFKQRFKDLLEETYAKSTSRLGEPRTYKELIEGKVKLAKILTIERTDEGPESYISNKWADFTETTINDMIAKGKGYKNTAMVRQYPKGSTDDI
ncbi:MAG: patatin-like phospholipase family protein [Thermoproteota archaeon]|nr:patatin-like phospholipase family protein [Thermoproteota archaeon]